MQDISRAWLQKLAPDQLDIIIRRAQLLQIIDAHQPIGRRAASSYVMMSEREIRACADALNHQGLINFSPAGMVMTEEGEALLSEAYLITPSGTALSKLEEMLMSKLDVANVTVVSSQGDEEQVLQEVGRATAHRLRQMVKPNMVVAIAGGRTMAATARAMVPCAPGVMVVPARGGMTTNIQTQANMVAGELANRMNAQYRLIHLPEGLSIAALKEMVKLPDIRETIELMRSASIVVMGIGRADVMARRRGMSETQEETLLTLGAVGESLGDFFNIDGHTVYRTPSVSAELHTMREDCRIVAAACGLDKGEAIVSAVRHHPPDTLILDEGAARSVLDCL
jgi:central glycolytic genes regulator